MKPKLLKLRIREYVDNADENSTAFSAHTQQALVSYFNTVADRKLFAFFFQNNPSNVAQLLGLSDDDKRNLGMQLQRIKKEFENKITNNGGNFAAMKTAVESMKNSQIQPSRSGGPSLYQQQLDQITSFVDGSSADSLLSSLLTLSELGSVSQRTRKLAAFVFKFDQGAVASITSTTNDNALQYALAKLKKEVKEEINENGGDFEAFKNAIQQGGERVLGSRLIEVDNDFEDVGTGGDLQLVVVSSSDDSSTIQVGHNFGYHLAKKMYEDAILGMNGLVRGTTEYGTAKDYLSTAKARLKAITILKDERKSKMTGGAIKLSDLLRSGLGNNDNCVKALAAYLVCEAKDLSLHSQKDALSRRCYDAYNAISFPDLDNLEESESYLEGELREKLGEGLVLLGGKMNNNMRKWHNKYKMHRSETLEYYAKECLDPDNELAMKLLAQIEDKVKVLQEKEESRLKRNRDAKRHRDRAKKEAKLYAGGSLTMSELNNEAKKLYDQKTCSTVRRNK